MPDLTGWLLDVYAGEQDATLWVLGEDGGRHCLRHPFPVTFYATGAAGDLRRAWRWFGSQPEAPRLGRVERRDLFSGPVTALAVEVQHPADQPKLFRRAAQVFPGLAWYDADLPLALRYSAVFGLFPLAHCRLKTEGTLVRDIAPLDSPWDLEPVRPPVRVMMLEPDCDPFHAEPRGLFVSYNGCRYRQPFEPPRRLLVNLGAILKQYDPDLLLTAWGDTWLLPRLLELSAGAGHPLPLPRDPDGRILHKGQRTYYAYGQVIYRGAQVHLAGRWHLDIYNAIMYHDYGLEGVLELARVTGLPVQTVARTSPGTGISAMQMATALQQGVMIPWRKQQAESPKSVLDLVRADMGGMVYQPTTGLHADVAEIDFVSMYPSIMAHFNISPETILPGRRDPETGLPLTVLEPGLVPQTLRPLLQKRIALKTALMGLSKWDSRRKPFLAAASAHKWLLVTCFGYLGYKNARFGRIEAHEAVTAYGREALLRAKEAAEDLGFEVLHMYVDGIWVKKQGSKTPPDFQPLLDAILERTGLPISLDGVFRWVAFLPSRLDARVPVPNRYFGVFQSGEIKARGIELRRRDTPAFVRETQQALLEALATAPDVESLPALLDEAWALVRKRLADLKAGRVPVEKLIVRQTLSRELERYRSPSPAAVAAQQLAGTGKNLRPGQSVRLVYTLGRPGVRAWDLAGEFDRRSVNIPEYRKLLLRAAQTVLSPFGKADDLQGALPIPLPHPSLAPGLV